MRDRINTLARLAATLVMVGALGACKGFLDVQNPGPIPDADLTSSLAAPGFVAGMSGDLSDALDEIVRIGGITSDDLKHGGSYSGEAIWVTGVIKPEDINSQWALMQKARWTAEHGIERLKALQGFSYETDSLAARANLLAGFANRMLGEMVCTTTIDGGPEQPNTVHFKRAEDYFSEAIRLAETVRLAASKTPFASLTNAAYAGRASVRAWQGNWTSADADAAKVPSSFVYNAFYSTNSFRENNSLVQETYVRREFTLFGTQWAQVFNDPRVPWDTIYTNASKTAIQKGQDGKTNFFRQRKYTDLGSEIPLVKGTEMLMLRAEKALRDGDIATAFGFINQQRAVYGLSALAVPTDIKVAWTTLEKERGAVTWLEGRRLWDLRRWFNEGSASPAYNAFLSGRNKGIPISLEERQASPTLLANAQTGC
jgi:starch-binding outer membrane protein, SusD/RagB family